MSKPKTGTREWSEHSVNCILGCGHRCLYCYARADAVRRGQCPNPEAWGKEYHRVRPKEVTKRRKKLDGRVMFPTTHDLEPEHTHSWLPVLHRLLDAGNEVLIVSKPHLASIDAIRESCHVARNRILFRFTIGAMDDEILSYWEPGAPAYKDRREALQSVYYDDFQTSISIEPMLDQPNVVPMFHVLEPYVTETIWIGMMNHPRSRCTLASEEAIARIEAGQTDAKIHKVYEALKDEPKVRWKDSIKRVVGIPLATETTKGTRDES